MVIYSSGMVQGKRQRMLHLNQTQCMLLHTELLVFIAEDVRSKLVERCHSGRYPFDMFLLRPGVRNIMFNLYETLLHLYAVAIKRKRDRVKFYWEETLDIRKSVFEELRNVQIPEGCMYYAGLIFYAVNDFYRFQSCCHRPQRFEF